MILATSRFQATQYAAVFVVGPVGTLIYNPIKNAAYFFLLISCPLSFPRSFLFPGSPTIFPSLFLSPQCTHSYHCFPPLAPFPPFNILDKVTMETQLYWWLNRFCKGHSLVYYLINTQTHIPCTHLSSYLSRGTALFCCHGYRHGGLSPEETM